MSVTEFVDTVEVLLRSNATLDDALLVDLFVVVGKLASSVEATEADILVETAELLAYLSSRALEQGGVRSVATPEGPAMEAAVLTADSLDAGFVLGPFRVPPLPIASGTGVAIVWPANPYPGNVSDSMMTFTCWQGGRAVALNNLTPPLVFDIPDAESMAVERGQITERRCVFWNTTSRSWRTDGVETQRKNFTHVQCASSHATSFSVEWQKRACSFCATDIPAKFLHVEFGVPVASWIALACLSSLYLCCIPLCMRDRKDWQSLETNSESYFRLHHRNRVSSCLPRWFQKTKPVGARRQPTHMSMSDFEATAPSAVLRNPSPCETRRLYVSHPLLFRAGGTVVVNKGGATEETHVVSNFTPNSLVITSGLAHTHERGEVVIQKVRESRVAASQDQNEGGSVVIHVVPAAGVSGGLAVASLGSSAAACGPSTDFKDHDGVIDVDAVLDAASEVSVLGDDTDADLPAGASLLMSLCGATVCDGLGSGEWSEAPEVDVEEARAEGLAAEFGTGEAQDTCVKQASDTHPSETRQTAPTGRPRRALPSRSIWRASAEDVWATLKSLARHLTPHWLGYSLHMSRAERFCLLVTSIVTCGSWQCLVFVLGPGCQHEPRPAVCQSSGAFTDWDRVTHALGSAALSCITTFSIFFLFNRPFVYGPRSRVEKERIIRRWVTRRQLAWVAVVVVHVVCLALVLRTTQFFAHVILWRWVRGLVLSTATLTFSSPMVRALRFIHVALNHYTVHGRRTL